MKPASYPPTPELDRMRAVKDDSQVIGQFLDSLSERGLTLCEHDDRDRLWPVNKSIERLLADYYEIDLTKVENERRAILNHIRA